MKNNINNQNNNQNIISNNNSNTNINNNNSNNINNLNNISSNNMNISDLKSFISNKEGEIKNILLQKISYFENELFISKKKSIFIIFDREIKRRI